MQDFEVAVVGDGFGRIGRSLGARRAGRKVALVAPKVERADARTTALMDQSIRFIDSLGIWDKISEIARPCPSCRSLTGPSACCARRRRRFRAADLGL